MHILNTKQSMVQYVKSYKPPFILVKDNHPSIYYNVKDQQWGWHRPYLIGLSMKQLRDLCEYLEDFYKVDNYVNNAPNK